MARITHNTRSPETQEQFNLDNRILGLPRIEAFCSGRVNFASAQNAVPVIHKLRVVNEHVQDLEDVRLGLVAQPAFVQQKTWNLDRIATGDAIEISDRDLSVDMAFLDKLTEAERGHLTFELRSGEDAIAHEVVPIEVLARDEWGGLAAMDQILAAFVSPNDPAVAQLLKEASRLLEAAGYSGSLDGYQSKDPRRSWMLAAAIWSATTALNLSYAEPPKSFERQGQKVRDPGRIVGEGLATCLDTSLLLAGALEATGLRPILVFVKGHAFAGVWLQDMAFRSAVERDPTELRKAISAHELIVFETTLLCRRPAVSFEQAMAEARKRLSDEQEHEFDRAIDIARCRSAAVRPLSTRREPRKASTPEDATAAAPLPPPPDFGLLPGELVDEVPTDAQGRIARWQRKLLDLSLRNRLLNFADTKQSIPLVLLEVPRLEDMLADGIRFSITSLNDENPVGDRDSDFHRQQYGEDIEATYAREALDRKELCAPLAGKELTGRLTTLYRKAKSDMSEGGTNTLFLAVGFLRWKKSAEEKRVYRSPLLLLPVKLTRRSAMSGYKLSHHEDEVRFNATLLQFLKQDFGLRIPVLEGTLPTDDSGIDVQAVFETVRTAVRDTPGFEVSEEASLSTFSFAKYLMWKDLVDRTDELRKNRLVKHLIDSPEEEYPNPVGTEGSSTFPEPHDVDRRVKPKDLLTPLPADSSQLVAVLAAEQGRDFVIIGPPGTGKSQTISNIIAHCLAKGRTVLFVAEKSVALDVVYRRLKQYGLGEACLELHSNKASRARVLRQLGVAWDRSATEADHEWVQVTSELEVKRDRLNAYVKALHAQGTQGFSVFEAIGIAASRKATITLSFDNADAHDPQSFDELCKLAREAGVVWDQAKAADALDSVMANEWSYAWEAGFLQNAEKVVVATETARARACELAETLELPPDSGVSAPRCDLLECFAKTAENVADDDFRPAFEANLPALRAALDPFTALLARIDDAKSRLTGTYAEEQILQIPVDELDRNWREASTRMWPFSAMGRRKIRKLLATYAKDEELAPDPAMDIAQIRILQKNISALADNPLAVTPIFDGSATVPALLHDWVSKASAFRSVVDDIKTSGGSGAACETLAAPSAGNSDISRAACAFRDAMAELRQARMAHAAHAGGGPEISGLAELKSAFDAMLAQKARLADRVRWVKLRGIGAVRRLGPLLDALETGDVPPADAEDVFRAAYCHWWLPLALDRSEVLRGFLAWDHEDLRKTFCRLDEKAQSLASAQIRLALANNLPAKDGVPRKSELGVLRHQLSLTRPSMAIRELIGHMPSTFTKLTPCVLMSPLSIAQYLPAGHQGFDMVIFDEASQITTWDAVGAIARGRQSIVVGDPKQLPPTNFFGRVEAEEEDVELHEKDLPSILDEVAAAGLPPHQLNWHYRSRDEGLIAFSNRKYYGGRLVTFPAPTTGGGAVRLHRLSGVFARGKGRTNRVEADSIVAMAVDRMKAALKLPKSERKSFGVITFNVQQQGLILDLLDDARRKDQTLEWFFEEDREEPMIVKNLENIQGDERDVMMFSITFGPDDAGKITMNFGALNREGGERRLNVAVTRAREELHVFASFDSHVIDLARTSATGVDHLKQFLDYVERGPVALVAADDGSLGPAENPFEEAVANALRDKGWEVRTQIGVSGFRIDLGVVHPDYAGTFVAGVECDGYTYHRSASARDRDRIRESVLTGLEWNILRVWSTDWFRNASEVTHRLHESLTRFLTEDREQRAVKQAEAKVSAQEAERKSPAARRTHADPIATPAAFSANAAVKPEPERRIASPAPPASDDREVKDMTKEEPFSATFKLDKETKNTIRYAEEAEQQRPVVGMLYVQKDTLQEPYPKKIRVTIEPLG